MDKDGNTLSHVFRGAVEVHLSGSEKHDSIVLRENESVRADQHGSQRATLRRVAAGSHNFVRQVVRVPKFIDLLDIVAGGDGAGQQRERGIDPLTGMEDPAFSPGRASATAGIIAPLRTGRGCSMACLRSAPGGTGPDRFGWPRVLGIPQDRRLHVRFHLVAGLPHPVGRSGSGRRLELLGLHFPPEPRQRDWPRGRGMLAVHPNAGITFDLRAIAQPGSESGSVLCQHRQGLQESGRDVGARGRQGQITPIAKTSARHAGTLERRHPVDVALQPNDRFLTLASTDGGDGSEMDWVVFGDPVLRWATEGSETEAVR